MRNNFAILILLFLVLTGCEKAFMEKDPKAKPVEVFESLWTTLDKKYSFFVYKNINWDSIYGVYRQKVRNNISNDSLFRICAEVLYKLEDGHVNLYTPFDFSRNWSWIYDYPANFNRELLMRNYLDTNYRITGSLYNKEIRNVGYIYYGSFATKIQDKEIDSVLKQFKDLPGIIIDVRDNGGGSLANARKLASRFADKSRLVGYRKYKDGEGHQDFTKRLELVQAPGGDMQYTKPVVILTNRSSYSATNEFVLRMKEFPHVTQIGDKTGGGGGLPIYSELPNGWRFRFSSTMTLDKDTNNIENGIYPDIKVPMNAESAARGIDTILETAIEYIKNK